MPHVVTKKPQVHLVVPDSHAHPDYSNERYDWLAELILDIKPDVVIDIGDWFDMPSLCSYDRGTKGFEGRRYQKDIAAGIEAQDRMLTRLRKQKKKLPRSLKFSYRPITPETATCPAEQIPAVVLSPGPEPMEIISGFAEPQDALQPFATTISYLV